MTASRPDDTTERVTGDVTDVASDDAFDDVADVVTRRETDGSVDYSDSNVVLDADEDRWAWRARLRRHPATHLAWRIGVGVVGTVVTVGGLIMVPAPGPGWAVVILGLVILASEFEFAQKWLEFVKHHVQRWNTWVMAQRMSVRLLIGLATLILIWLIFWVMFIVTGVPPLFPDWAEDQLHRLPGVD